MKKVISILPFLFLAVGVKAADVPTVIGSSMTVNVVAVSSFSATQIDNSGSLMVDRTAIWVQNLDASNKVYCSQKSNVTTSTGFALVSGVAPLYLPLAASGPNGRLTLYCITANTSGSSNVAIIQGK